MAQVKGEKFSLSHRDFIHVSNRDGAAVGCYVTLESVSSPDARKEVAKEGKITVNGCEYRRIQLWSISDYFKKRLPQLPMMNNPGIIYIYGPAPDVKNNFQMWRIQAAVIYPTFM